jgi:ATP-dependent HslUV protease subunit HslV
MSIAVAVKKGGQLVLGADTQQNFGENAPGFDNLKESKIMPIGKGYLAATSWGLYSNILDDYLQSLEEIPLRNKRDVFNFFMAFWHVLHKQYSFINDQCEDKNSPFGDLDASFLVVTKDRIFYVSGDMSVTEFHKFHAIGSGCEYALGAMHVMYGDPALDAAQIAKKAVRTAMNYNIYCGGKIEIRSL